MALSCPVCGNSTFRRVWTAAPELVAEWRLTPEELALFHRQQGERCTNCNSNLRAGALALGILRWGGNHDWSGHGTLWDLVKKLPLFDLHVLDLNGCDVISRVLERLLHYKRADYPAVDMQALPFAERSFDLVLHSETLEHVPDPICGLRECRRVLRPGGACIFTVPMLPGRLTQAPAVESYHQEGGALGIGERYRVWTEFGGDGWTLAARAGFPEVRLVVLEYPAAVAFCCIK